MGETERSFKIQVDLQRLQKKERETEGVMRQKSNTAKTIGLMRKQKRASCRSHAERTGSEDETN